MRDAHDVARERSGSDERTGDSASPRGLQTSPRGRHAAFWTVLLGAAVLALTAFAIWRRWSLLADTPYPVGIDGYFYPIQLRAVLERGELAYPDYPLAFYLLAPFAALTDPIVGVKLGSAVLGGLAVVPAFFIGARLSGSRAAGLVAGAFVAVSAGGAFLAMEFVKNGIGVTVALTAIWLVLRALDVVPGHRWFSGGRVVVALLGIASAGLTHKLALVLVIVIAIPATLAAFADRGVLRGRRLIYATAALAVVVLAALAIVGGVGHAMGAFSTNALWSSPALVAGDRVMLTMGYEATWAAGVAVLVGAMTAFRWPPEIPRAARATTWALVVLAVVIALPWLGVEDPQGVGFRLRVVAFVPLALLAAVATAGLVGLVPRARAFLGERIAALIAYIATVLAAMTAVAVGVGLRSPVSLIPLGLVVAAGLARAARTSTSLAVIAALAIVVVAPARRDEGRVIPHPAMVASVSALAGKVPTDDTVIIPERHIMFMAVWYARVHAQLQPQGVAPAHRWRAVTLSFIRAGSHLDEELMAARRPDILPAGLPPPVGLHPSHPNGFVLVRDDTWQFVVSRVPEPERTRIAAWPTI